MNQIQCKHCGDVITSRSVHDFQKCSCGAVFVDGGEDYQRIGFPREPMDEHLTILASPKNQ